MSDPRHHNLDDWIDKARSVSIQHEMMRRGRWTKRHAGDTGNPCPGCGGTDRFAVNVKKNLFHCRKSGAGGDAIAFVMHVDSCSFLKACEILTGEPAPGRDETETAEERAKREKEREARIAAENRRRADEEETSRKYRDEERRRTRAIWDNAKPLAGTIGEDYLALRGIKPGPCAKLRFVPHAPLWSSAANGRDRRILHEGPALIAAISGLDGRFAGIEQIWIDLTQEKGKALVPDPATGVFEAAKKTRGLKKGGSVLLASPSHDVLCSVIGEGIETVLSVYCALLEANDPLIEVAEFRAALSITNLAGLAAGGVKHPTLLKEDAKGRKRPQKVGNDELRPVEDDWPVIKLPETIREIILLGDGDSEPFATELAMKRAGKRHARAYPEAIIKVAWPRAGQDFNDQWKADRGVAA